MAYYEQCSNNAEIEEEFVYFYCDVMRQMYEEELAMGKFFRKCKQVSTSVMQLNSNMDDDGKHYYSYLHFCNSPIRFSYILAFSIINTCTAYLHFLKFFNENEDLKSTIQTKQTIRICCLGGGPGVEAVAICKIISDFFKPIFYNSYIETASGNRIFHVSVNVTIVDICFDWSKEAFAIMNAMRESRIVDSEHVTIETNFIQANLTELFETDLIEEMKQADIVTMVQLGNDIVESAKLSALCRNLSIIVRLMKIDSCLFIQENTEGSSFRDLKNTVCRTTSTDVESYEDSIYLKPTILQKFRSLSPIDWVWKGISPICMSRASSCIWVHTDEAFIERNPKKMKQK